MTKKLTASQSPLLFAETLTDEIAPDWRYSLVLPYIRHSNSYLAVRDKHRGRKVAKDDLPSDADLVLHVANWLDILGIGTDIDLRNETNWLEHAQKSLYGFRKAIPTVGHTFTKANESALINSGDLDYPCIMLRIPLTLTMTEALSQIKSIFKSHATHYGAQFGTPLPDSHKGQYKLEPSKLRQDTLVKGVDALTLYKAGVPLWKIGNQLDLSANNKIKDDGVDLDQDELADKKRVLSIMAKRLINTAFLVAENAARGRFPSDKPFPEAILGTHKRTAGRPIGSKRPKRLNVR